MVKCLPLILITILASCSREMYLERLPEEFTNEIYNSEIIIAADLKILKDDSYGPSVPGAFKWLHIGDTLVTETSRLHRIFHFPLGRRRYVKYPCTLINSPQVHPGTDTGQYHFLLIKTANRYYPSMLRLEVWQEGSVKHDSLKSIYVFQTNCRPDIDCYQWPYDNDVYQSIPPFSADPYDGYADITEVDTSKKFSILPTINWGKEHLEQNSSQQDNSVLITVSNGKAIRGDSSALKPIAPHSFTRNAEGSQVTITWEGTGEWWDVEGYPGRLTSPVFTVKRNRTIRIRSVNRYFASDYVSISARK